MRPNRSSIRRGFLLGATTLAAAALPAAAQPLPSNASPTCAVQPAEFAGWFQSGTPTANGVVNPANSVTFPNQPNCSFYKWSEQMFLWLTSPAPVTYGGGGGRIFSSPAFFDVSPMDASGNRTFIAHEANIIRPFPVRVAQAGPHGLPVIFSRAGQMLEVERTPPAAIAAPKPVLRTTTGATAEIARAQISAVGRPQFFDRANRPITLAAAPLPVGLAQLRQVPTVRKIIVNNIPIFINPQNQVVDVEQNQADDGVLEAQNGSLIYYETIVNDVYAYFATGTDDGGITPKPTQFPTTQADLNKVVSFAQVHGKTFPDPDALAIEVKSSWVEATSLPSTADYITTTATIPTYDRTNPDKWVPNGQKTTTLALVGIHVVGSTNGHPEMVWATFEHVRNAPAAAYTYNATSGPNPHTVAQNTAGAWLFAANNAAAPFNAEHMMQSGADIVSVPPNHISASNVLRAKAWGSASNVNPNPLDNTAASNTEIIAVNNSVLGKLLGGDIRANYVLTGTTWTINGAAPTGSNQVGTSELANSTMETFQQGADATTTHGAVNCFSCHVTNATGVSHVFGALKPLF